MAQALDYVEYLTREIGARPAGTEEEQQAALYIADEFQKEAGFSAAIEEFTSTSNLEGYRAILAMISIVVSVLAMLFNVLTAPALVLAIIAAVIYALEAFDKPVISNRLARGASQNVVARYLPHGDQGEGKRGARTRKIVLLAHYDTGKVMPKVVQRAENSGLPLGMICLGGMVAAAFLLLLRVFVGGTGGAGLVFINILTIIAIIILALPIVKAILYRVAPYNEGANNNASGVAALLEVARHISQGSVSEADLAGADGVVIHGEAAALESGLVPEGAELNYEAQPTDFEVADDASEEDRLLAAKAAIAALTGQYVEQRVYSTSSDAAEAPSARQELASAANAVAEAAQAADDAAAAAVQGVEFAAAAAAEAAEAEGVELAVAPQDAQDLASLAAPSPSETGGFENAPSWFVAAQRNAKRSVSTEPVQRSRYTEAIDAAERELAERERRKAEEERARRELELREMHEAARAAISGGAAADAAQEPAQPEQPSIEFAPIDIENYDAAPAIQLEPIEAPEQGKTVIPAKPKPETDQPADPGQTVAYIPEHLRNLLHKSTSVSAEDLEAQGGAAVAAALTQPEPAPASAVEPEPAPAVEPAPASKPDPEPAQAPEPEPQPARATQSRLAGLPPVQQDSQTADADAPSVPENTNPSRSGLFRMLRTDVPTLSGPIAAQEPERPRVRLTKADLPSLTGALQPVEAAASAEAAPSRRPALNSLDVPQVQDKPVDYSMQIPVSADLAEAAQEAATAQPAEPALRDALSDESEQAAQAHKPGEVQMPSSRAGGFFSRFRRKEEALGQTPQEWLDVDEDFEARKVGRERGSWESFREDDSDQYGGSWEGGAFSRVRLGHVNMRSGAEDEPGQLEEAAPELMDEEQAINEEIEQIYHFRNPLYDADIWFVAVGSDTDLHDGARAFIQDHKAELRGAMFVEIESLGLGELSYVAEEGLFRRFKASSRIKRFTRDATEATGIGLGSVSTRTDSITTAIQKQGFQAIHLMGVEDGLPALKGSADDILENIDELTFEENINYLLELMKQS